MQSGFKDKLTDLDRAAITALRKVVNEEGWFSAVQCFASATAGPMDVEHQKKFVHRDNGKPTTFWLNKRTGCPPKEDWRFDGMSGSNECWNGFPVDHPEFWQDRESGKRHVLAHLYQAGNGEILAWAKLIQEEGVDVYISPFSSYYPGASFAVHYSLVEEEGK